MVWADAQLMVANFSCHLAALKPSWDNLHPTPCCMAPFATHTDMSPFSPPWDPKKTVGHRADIQDVFNVVVAAMMLREIKSFLHLLFGKRVSIPLPAPQTGHWGFIQTTRRRVASVHREDHFFSLGLKSTATDCSALGSPFLTGSFPKRENRFSSVLKNVAPAWFSPEMVTRKAHAPPANRARFIASRARGVLCSLCKHNQGSDSVPC